MVPSEWGKCVIVPIPKKRGGRVYKMDEFRQISLVSVAYTVMCSILHGRLAQVVEGRNLVAEEQGGFRRGRGSQRPAADSGAVGTDVRKGNVCWFH